MLFPESYGVNEKKIQQHLDYIERKLEEHEAALAEADGDEEKKQEVRDQIQHRKEQKQRYQGLKKQLDASDENQISTSDPESRHLMVRNNITEVAYNLQTTVDARHKLLLDYQVTNTNDSRALAPMVARAKSIIGHPFTVLFDKGYHNGQQIAQCHNWGIDTLVAPRDTARPNGQQRVREYEIENFTYNRKEDYYECPEGQKLTTNGHTYKKGKYYQVKHYKSKACLGCKFRKLCTKSPHGRLIERSIYQENLERNRQNVEDQPERYRQRQALVEHPFGTLKRQWVYPVGRANGCLPRRQGQRGL